MIIDDSVSQSIRYARIEGREAAEWFSRHRVADRTCSPTDPTMAYDSNDPESDSEGAVW